MKNYASTKFIILKDVQTNKQKRLKMFKTKLKSSFDARLKRVFST